MFIGNAVTFRVKFESVSISAWKTSRHPSLNLTEEVTIFILFIRRTLGKRQTPDDQNSIYQTIKRELQEGTALCFTRRMPLRGLVICSITWYLSQLIFHKSKNLYHSTIPALNPESHDGYIPPYVGRLYRCSGLLAFSLRLVRLDLMPIC